MEIHVNDKLITQQLLQEWLSASAAADIACNRKQAAKQQIMALYQLKASVERGAYDFEVTLKTSLIFSKAAIVAAIGETAFQELARKVKPTPQDYIQVTPHDRLNDRPPPRGPRPKR